MQPLNRVLRVKISPITPSASYRLPTKKHQSDAGWDLYAPEDIKLKSRQVKLVKLGFKMELPPQSFAMITPRSGLAYKQGITIVNSPGIIDEDYRGEVGVLLYKLTDGEYDITAGDRIAQMIILPRFPSIFEVTKVSRTQRGSGGFGSTGR